MPDISRRTLLVGGLGIAGVALVSKAALDRANDLPTGSAPAPGRRFVGQRGTGWTIAYPRARAAVCRAARPGR